MVRQTFKWNPANNYVKIPYNGEVAYEAEYTHEEARVLRHPQTIFIGGSGYPWKILEFTRLPGPPVDGRHPYRLVIERIQ